MPESKQSPEEKKVKSGAKMFLDEVEALGKKYGYGFASIIEPFLQDNGAYSFKTKIVVVELPKEK